MNLEEKTVLLATKVMGWYRGSKPWRCDGRIRWYSEPRKIVAYGNWNPFESWDDALMILEKATNWLLNMDGDGIVHCTITFDQPPYKNWGFSKMPTAPEAICEAALKAIKEVK